MYPCDVHCVHMCVIEENRCSRCFLGVLTDPMCACKGQTTKVEEKDQLKDKYKYFISILIMHIIYESNL